MNNVKTDSCWPKHERCDHRDYIDRVVTLSTVKGKVLARIKIDDDGFAQITPLDPPRTPVDFPWVAVFNICDNHHGHFERYG